MIQHDCGHGSFFRYRLANDWVGRFLGVLTLTPYDDWRRAHAIHHANSGHLDRRGVGDIDTLTVREFQALRFWGRVRYRLYRHPLVMFGLGAAYQFLLRHRLPIDLKRGGWQAWVSSMATNLSIANRGYHAGLVRRHWSVPAHALTTNASCRLGGSLAVLRAASVRTNVLGAGRGMEFLRGVASWKLSLRPAGEFCAGSQRTSACTMSTICVAAYRITGCRKRS